MKGTENTTRSRMGSRIRQAREHIGLSRQQLADKLSDSAKAPAKKMTMERIKQWEYGNNPVLVDWIPALCDALSFDVGYLFGEYDEHYRIVSDIASETGLSESAIQKLQFIRECNPEYSDVISAIVSDFNFEYLLCLIYNRILYSSPEYVVKPVVETKGGKDYIKNAKEFHDSIQKSEVRIQIDDLVLLAKKRNLFDSMISTALIDGMKNVAEIYQKCGR